MNINHLSRSDNGYKYVSNEFKNLCALEGIRRELIVPYNKQENGVDERKKSSIVGEAREMLNDQGINLHLWVNA